MADKELESKLMNLSPPLDHTLSMEEQMQNKKTYEKQADTLCVQADELIRSSNFDEGLSKLMEAYKIVMDHPWAIKQQQIYDLIQSARFRRQEHIKKEQLRAQQHHENQIAEEQQKELVQAHKRELDREKLEKEQKLKQLQDWKQKEEEISSKAFKLLEEGQKLLKKQQFAELISQYSEAKRLFLEIKWNAEAQKVEDSIEEFRKQQEKIIQKLETDKILREEQVSTWKTKELELQDQSDKRSQEVEEKRQKLQQSISRKDLETQVYEYLDKAAAYEKSGNLSNAIQMNENAKDGMGRLGWKQEIIKITDSIKLLQKRLHQEQEKQKQEKLSQQHKEEEAIELRRRIGEQEEERKKVEDERQWKTQELHNQKQREKEVSEQAFQKIEEIEKLVKKYKEYMGAERYSMESPFIRAKEIYQNSRDLLLSIGWKAEADKLTSAISMYDQLYIKDQNERILITKRHEKEQEDQRRLETSIRMQKQEQERKEQERKEKLLQLDKMKEREMEISERAFREIDEIEKSVKNYKENVIIKNYTINCPYLEARNVYQNFRKLLLSIGWKEQADKLSSSISMYETLHLKDQKERATLLLKKKTEEIEQKKLRETILLQQQEKELQERERIQKLQAQGKKKEYEDQISKRAFARIDEIEKEIKYYKEHAIEEKYAFDCPYLKAKEIYETSREELLDIGWKREADKFFTSISLYENLYKKDLIEREKQELLKKKHQEDEKQLEESIRLQKEEKERKELERIQQLQELGKRKEYETEISKRAFARIEEIEKEVKYYKEHVVAENFALNCPYMPAMEVYRISREDFLSIGWKEEADKLNTSISMYENSYKKDLIEREKQELIRNKQRQEEKQLQESIRLQKEEKERKEQEYLKTLQDKDRKRQYEEEVSQQAFKKIEEIEKVVKYYKEHVVAEQFNLECPYSGAILVYQQTRDILLEIDWKKEADKLQTSISMYEKLAQKDEQEREQFLKKRQKEEEDRAKQEEEIRLRKEEQENQERERLRLLREQTIQKQRESEISEEAFHIIEDIEKEVAHYKERVRIENYNLTCPYQRAKEIYQQARDKLLEIGWKKEADKLNHSILLYTRLEKEDLEVRDAFRKRLEKQKKEEQDLQETIRKERERLALEGEKKEFEIAQKDLKRKENEELQQIAYKKLEEGNSFIQEKDFESATERLNDALNIFKKIKWINGVKLTEDAIKYKENERQKFEKLLRLEHLALQEQKKKEREFQEFLEEQRRIKEQEEQNRKLELLRMDMASREINEKQDSAFKKLEEGNDLVKIREFKKASNLFSEALRIFQEIAWVDGVERTKQAISHNLIEQERYNQQLECQKRLEQEKQREEQELQELIRKRQEMTQMEEQKKRLQLEQQNEMAERINKRQQEALALLEQGNERTTQYKFEEAEKLFLQAMQLFQGIQWNYGIKITEEVIKHNKEEKNRYLLMQKRDDQARLEQFKQQKELEQMLQQQRLTTHKEAQLKELQQQQQTEKLREIQTMESKAIQYLENGNQAIRDKQFDRANDLFVLAMKLFQEMGWQKGIEMTNTALDYNQKEMLKFENEQLREHQKIEEAKTRQAEINQLIQESKEEKIKKELEWKQKLEEKTQRLDEENQIKDQIFALLEQGSKLAAKNEYLSAIDLYKKTIPLFEKISWPLKQDQVIDLIDTTQQDYENYRTHLAKQEAIREKQLHEEEELRNLIKTEQEKEAEQLKIMQQQQLHQIEQDKLKEQLIKEAKDEINKAAVMLERRKFENALVSLNIALENFKKLGWTREAKATEEQITEVQKQQREAYKPIDREQSASNLEISEQGYKEIEEADKLIRQKEFRKALPHLEEAKRLFEKIQWSKAIKMVELRIRETERLDKEKQEIIEKIRARKSRKTEKEAYDLLEKVDKFRREKHYDYALTSAREAQKIFQELSWEREANELNSLIETINRELTNQNQAIVKDQEVRSVNIKVEEEEERKDDEIIEERRRRRRENKEKLKED